MTRAVIDQRAFEQLVAGDEVLIEGVSDGCHIVAVKLILSDIGFTTMMHAIGKAMGAKPVDARTPYYQNSDPDKLG